MALPAMPQHKCVYTYIMASKLQYQYVSVAASSEQDGGSKLRLQYAALSSCDLKLYEFLNNGLW